MNLLFRNPCLTQKPRDKIFINLNNLDQMKNLTVLKLQGLTEIQFKTFPSSMDLVNLKTLVSWLLFDLKLEKKLFYLFYLVNNLCEKISNKYP